MYEMGKGVKQDIRKAVQCYERAAANGSNTAMFNLGMLYVHCLVSAPPNPPC
jgi:TPR repeat protein